MMSMYMALKIQEFIICVSKVKAILIFHKIYVPSQVDSLVELGGELVGFMWTPSSNNWVGNIDGVVLDEKTLICLIPAFK